QHGDDRVPLQVLVLGVLAVLHGRVVAHCGRAILKQRGLPVAGGQGQHRAHGAAARRAGTCAPARPACRLEGRNSSPSPRRPGGGRGAPGVACRPFGSVWKTRWFSEPGGARVALLRPGLGGPADLAPDPRPGLPRPARPRPRPRAATRPLHCGTGTRARQGPDGSAGDREPAEVAGDPASKPHAAATPARLPGDSGRAEAQAYQAGGSCALHPPQCAPRLDAADPGSGGGYSRHRPAPPRPAPRGRPPPTLLAALSAPPRQQQPGRARAAGTPRSRARAGGEAPGGAGPRADPARRPAQTRAAFVPAAAPAAAAAGALAAASPPWPPEKPSTESRTPSSFLPFNLLVPG
ncbi:hypothetical protein EI555_013662, partial [Monodon monoceros]